MRLKTENFSPPCPDRINKLGTEIKLLNCYVTLDIVDIVKSFNHCNWGKGILKIYSYFVTDIFNRIAAAWLASQRGQHV